MDWVKNLIIAAKKRFLYKKDAEQVDIRVTSIPDWLYKITIKRPDEVKSKAYNKKQEIQGKLKDIGVDIDRIDMHQILDKTISKYKKESVETNKEKYVEKIKKIISKGDKQTDTIEDYRKYFKNIVDQIAVEVPQLEIYRRRIDDFHAENTNNIAKKLSELHKSITLFQSEFDTSNDQKVKYILDKLKILHESESKIKEHMNVVEEYDKEIEKLRDHIYKLGEKISSIRQSTRFKDVIKKESKLGEILEKIDDLYDTYAKKFAKIEIVLYQYAIKVKEESLVKEYCSHINHAIDHDTTFKIIDTLKGLLSDLENKRTKIRQNLEDNAAERYISLVQDILKTLHEDLEKLQELQKQAGLARRSVRKHVILSELEDTEGRKAFYQKKLVSLNEKRREVLLEIDGLHITTQKEKIRKELLLLTGYDVNIIYDEK